MREEGASFAAKGIAGGGFRAAWRRCCCCCCGSIIDDAVARPLQLATGAMEVFWFLISVPGEIARYFSRSTGTRKV